MAHPLLTDRQNDVMQLVCSGDHSHHEIADILGMRRLMLTQHLLAIRRRLDRESIDDLCQVFSEDTPPEDPKDAL